MESSFHNKPSVLVGNIYSTTNDNSSYAYNLINVILASLLNLCKSKSGELKQRTDCFLNVLKLFTYTYRFTFG